MKFSKILLYQEDISALGIWVVQTIVRKLELPHISLISLSTLSVKAVGKTFM